MRFARSTREAFPCERYAAMWGPYRRRSPIGRAFRLLGLLGLFAWLGALIGAGF